jgi:hypothetical protein
MLNIPIRDIDILPDENILIDEMMTVGAFHDLNKQKTLSFYYCLTIEDKKFFIYNNIYYIFAQNVSSGEHYNDKNLETKLIKVIDSPRLLTKTKIANYDSKPIGYHELECSDHMTKLGDVIYKIGNKLQYNTFIKLNMQDRDSFYTSCDEWSDFTKDEKRAMYPRSLLYHYIRPSTSINFCL